MFGETVILYYPSGVDHWQDCLSILLAINGIDQLLTTVISTSFILVCTHLASARWDRADCQK